MDELDMTSEEIDDSVLKGWGPPPAEPPRWWGWCPKLLWGEPITEFTVMYGIGLGRTTVGWTRWVGDHFDPRYPGLG